MEKEKFDLAVIGGGPAGYIASSYATQFGKKVVLIEKNKLGGCCLNVGCIPTKTILEAANRYSYALKSEQYGIYGDVSFEWRKLKQYSNEVISTLRKGVESLLTSRKCVIVSGEATLQKNNEILVDDRIICADNIIIASGSRPDIPKAYSEIENVITSDEFWDLDIMPKSMVIVGGGVIGCEIASALSRLGTKISIIEQMPNILNQLDSEAVKEVNESLIEIGVDIYCNEGVIDILEAVDTGSVLIKTQNHEVNAEYVLWATGRKPVIPRIVGLELNLSDKGFIDVDKHLESSLDGVFAIGDVNGKNMLAHVAISQAMELVEYLYANKEASRNTYIPQTVFTNPAIASIGLAEVNCRNMNVAVGVAPYSSVGYSHVINRKNGFFKIIRDIETDTLIGAEIVGYNACELIHILSPFIGKRIKVEMLDGVMFAHPTLSEGIKIAIENSYVRSPQI